MIRTNSTTCQIEVMGFANPVISADMTGFVHVQRKTGSPELRLFINGSQVGTGASTKASVGGSVQPIGAYSQDNVISSWLAGTFKCFGIGQNLLGLESSLYTAWNEYNTAPV